MMKKILIVSPYFTPFAGVGAVRMDSLTRYLLMTNQYDITVLKNSNDSYGNKITKTDNHEFRSFEVESNDTFMQYCKAYKAALKKILKKQIYDVVLITVGPFYTLPLIYMLKKEYNIPVILDMRDLWAHEPVIHNNRNIKDKIKSIIKDYLFERKAIKSADKVVVVAEDVIDVLKQFYSKELEKKSVVIQNGFDDSRVNIDDLEQYKLKSDRQHTIGVFGKFSEYISKKQLCALSKALKECKESFDIEFLQIGEEEYSLRENLLQNDIQYEQTGYMEYQQGIYFMRENLAICLVSSDLDIGYGTKIFDYILCNKPIIFIGNRNSSIGRLLDTFENAFVCNNEDEIVEAIQYIISNHICTLDENINRLSYCRSVQNIKFEKMIKELC